MKRREQVLAIGLGLCLISGLVLSRWNASREGTVDPRKMWQARHADAIEMQARLEADLSWLEEESGNALAGELSRAQLVYQNAILELLQHLEITDATVIPAAVSLLKEDVSCLGLQLEFEASSAELAECLIACETGLLWHRISQLSVELLPEERLRVRMLLEALILTENADRERLDLRPAAEDPASTSQLADLFPTSEPPAEAPVAPSTPAPSVASADPAEDLILIALLGTAQHPEAWLYDRRRKSHQVLLTSAEITCGTFRGKIESMNSEGLLVTGPNGHGFWRLGHQLSELKLATVPKQ